MNESSKTSWGRRKFLASSLTFAAAAVGGLPTSRSAKAAPAASKKFRAAIIGHTGKGNYGHEHDLIFNDRDNLEVAAVADPDAEGRAKAAGRSKAQRQYADYREMLAQEKPTLVCVAPRWTDQHHAMAMAAMQAGAHVYLEKPFTPTLAEADELLAEAGRRGLKIAVAHQMRLAPSILFLKKAIEDGLIGELVEIRAHGKQDQRAGAEDMIVLGTHVFDLIRFLAGDPSWCTARVLQNGRDITRQDARPATENLGPIAGDEIYAQFAFANGVNATFVSRAKYRQTAGAWGMELIGSKGAVKILTEIWPNVFVHHRGEWTPHTQANEWRRIDRDPTLSTTAEDRGFLHANRRVVNDWLEAIESKREPICSGRAAMKALEMIMAVFHAGLSGQRVALPMTDRQHPFLAHGKG